MCLAAFEAAYCSRALQSRASDDTALRLAGTPISSNAKKLHNQIEFCSNY